MFYENSSSLTFLDLKTLNCSIFIFNIFFYINPMWGNWSAVGYYFLYSFSGFSGPTAVGQVSIWNSTTFEISQGSHLRSWMRKSMVSFLNFEFSMPTLCFILFRLDKRFYYLYQSCVPGIFYHSCILFVLISIIFFC